MRFIYVSIGLAIITTLSVFFYYKKKLDFENLYTMNGITLISSFVLWFALILFCNGQYTTKNCNLSSYEVVGYKGRYTSGLGNLEKGEIKANQWILTIIKYDKKETFVLDVDISSNNKVTKTMELQFCKGLLGTEYLNLEQMAR